MPPEGSRPSAPYSGTEGGKSTHSAFPSGTVLQSNHLVPIDAGKVLHLENSQLIIIAGVKVLGNGRFIRVKHEHVDPGNKHQRMLKPLQEMSRQD